MFSFTDKATIANYLPKMVDTRSLCYVEPLQCDSAMNPRAYAFLYNKTITQSRISHKKAHAI